MKISVYIYNYGLSKLNILVCVSKYKTLNIAIICRIYIFKL
jgi:hypothetical protein